VELSLKFHRLSLRTHEKLVYEVLFMRHRNVLIIGSLATLGLVIALGVIFFRVNTSPHDVLWTLTSLQVNGQTHELVPHVPITLTFHETSRTITGSSGCNSYQATYQQHNSQIRFQDFGRTAEGCLGPVGEQEYLYMQALEQTETLVVSANTMTLTGVGGKDILRFSSSQP
jgi:heat shock protein HslJ